MRIEKSLPLSQIMYDGEMKKIISLLILGTFLLFQSSCATIINGSTESISIQVIQSDAKVYINEVLVGVSEPNLVLQAEIPKRREIVIKVEKEQCDTYYKIVAKKIDLTTFLGLLIDRGLISILLVDLYATNAFHRASQNFFSVDLNCPTSTN